MAACAELETLRRRMDELGRQFAHAQSLAHVVWWHWEPGDDRSIWSDEMCRIFGQPPGFAPIYAEFSALVGGPGCQAVGADSIG